MFEGAGCQQWGHVDPHSSTAVSSIEEGAGCHQCDLMVDRVEKERGKESPDYFFL